MRVDSFENRGVDLQMKFGIEGDGRDQRSE